MLCDIVVLYVVKRKSYYREKKYQYVNDPDESGSEVRKLSKRGWGGGGCWRWGRLHIFLLNHRRPRARVKGGEGRAALPQGTRGKLSSFFH